jgi:hypothetical protein
MWWPLHARHSGEAAAASFPGMCFCRASKSCTSTYVCFNTIIVVFNNSFVMVICKEVAR